MKNDSPFFPGSLFGDSWFDHNGDGKLSGLETLQRDAYHMYMANQLKQEEQRNPVDTHTACVSTPANIAESSIPPSYYAVMQVKVDMEKADALARSYVAELQERIKMMQPKDDGLISVSKDDVDYAENFEFYAFHIQQIQCIFTYALHDLQILEDAHVNISSLPEVKQYFLELEEIVQSCFTILETLYPGLHARVDELEEVNTLPDIFFSENDEHHTLEAETAHQNEQTQEVTQQKPTEISETYEIENQEEDNRVFNRKIATWLIVILAVLGAIVLIVALGKFIFLILGAVVAFVLIFIVGVKVN